MTSKQLQHLLKQFPEGLEVKLFKGYKNRKHANGGGTFKEPIIHDFEDENILKRVVEKDECLLINPPIQ